MIYSCKQEISIGYANYRKEKSQCNKILYCDEYVRVSSKDVFYYIREGNFLCVLVSWGGRNGEGCERSQSFK